jgi:hypothetical protein
MKGDDAFDKDPYGVPVGVVPRVGRATVAGEREALDPVAQAVDNYIMMERKAKAWDDLYRQIKGCDMPRWTEEMDRLLRP